MELQTVDASVDLRGWTISSTTSEIDAAPITVLAELSADIPARDALLDRAMAPNWRRKASETLRRGRMPAEGLAFVARDGSGAVTGTVRLWDVRAGDRPALLLGPLAVDPSVTSSGIGSALMRHAIEAAQRLGHGAVLLMGDPGYYRRFGFSSQKTASLAMPGPNEPERLLGLELTDGALEGACGTLIAAGRKVTRRRPAA